MIMSWRSWNSTYWPHPQGQEGGWDRGSAGKIFATILLHSWFFLNWYAIWTYSGKVEFWPTDPTPRFGDGGRGRAKYLPTCCVAAFVILYNLICSIAMFSKSWFTDPIPVGGGKGGALRAIMWLHSLFSLNCYVTWPCSEKVEFWPFDPIPRDTGRGVCGQHICYNDAAYLIPFNLMCNMAMFWKSWILTHWPHPQCQGGGGRGVFVQDIATMLVLLWFSLIWYASWPCSENFEFLPFDPRGWDTGLRSKITFDMFHIYCTSVCMRS